MAITVAEFVKRTGAEEVAGNIILGIMADRKIVGSVTDGVFSFNDEGKRIIEELEAGTYGESAPEVEEVKEVKPAAKAK